MRGRPKLRVHRLQPHGASQRCVAGELEPDGIAGQGGRQGHIFRPRPPKLILLHSQAHILSLHVLRPTHWARRVRRLDAGGARDRAGLFLGAVGDMDVAADGRWVETGVC